MARRGHGEGTITKRTDGRWMARITLESGKRKAFYGKTRKEVQEDLITALRDKQQGVYTDATRQTVARFLSQWLEGTTRSTLRLSTFESYSGLIRLHILPAIGAVKLSKLTPQDLDRLYSDLLEKGLSPRTVQYVHAVLHRALEQALRWNLIARNPADAVEAPRPQRHEIRPLTPEQIGRLLDAAREDRLHALYVLALTTGMRQGELLGLRWADVALDKGTVHVRQQVRRLRGQGMHFSEPKTAKGRRTIALPDMAVDVLR